MWGSPKSPATMGPSTAETIWARVISLGVPGQDVPAADPALGTHEAGPLQGQQDLLEVGLGQAGALGDVAHRGRGGLGAVQGQREQRPAGVVTPGRHLHAPMLPGGGPLGPTVATGPAHEDRPGVPARGGADRRAASGASAEAPGSHRLWLARAAGPPAARLRRRVPDQRRRRAVRPGRPGPAPPPWVPTGGRRRPPGGAAGARRPGLPSSSMPGRPWRPRCPRGPGRTVTSVAPSTTAAALTSLVTGLPPAVHGVVGYRVQPRGPGDERPRVARGGSSTSAARCRPTGSSRSRHSRAARPRCRWWCGPTTPPPASPPPISASSELQGWHTPSGAAVEVGRPLRHRCPFVYAYYDGIDRVAHATGLTSTTTPSCGPPTAWWR